MASAKMQVARSKQAPQITEVAVPEVLTKWVIFGVEIEGVTPLLMHNPALMRGGATTEQKLGRKEIPTPEEEARNGLYRLPDGRLFIKADQLRQSMLVGARGLKIGKKSANVILAASVMEIPSEESFVLSRNGSELTDARENYEIDVRRAVVQRNGVLRARPMIALPWSLTARFLIDVSMLGSGENVVRALSQGGQIAGLLDYRPQKGGGFGRYQVVRAWTEA